MKTPARLSISVFQTATCRAMGISIWKTSPSEMSLENKVRKMVAKKKKEKRERERERERENFVRRKTPGTPFSFVFSERFLLKDS